MKNEVLSFIDKFKNKGTINTFTEGCCYWFAFILLQRFNDKNPKLMYDETMNHFGTAIGDTIYDITGDVTDKYYWQYFEELKNNDSTLYNRLKKYCIDLIDD